MVKINLKEFTKETKLSDKGVYMITNINTDIKYIGSTTLSFSDRWRSHLNGLRRNVGNIVLLNIYHKYGLSGFRFSILESMNNSSMLEIRNRERYWIEYYDTYHYGANCTENTLNSLEGHKTKPYTDEDKLKLLITSPNRKPVYLYDEDGNLVNRFLSSVDCDRYLGLRKGRTNWAINHPLLALKRKYYPTYEERTWCPKDIKRKNRLEAAKKAAITRKEHYVVTDIQKEKLRISNPKRREVALYDLEGNFVKKFNSFNECDDYLKLYRGTTSKVFRGLTKVLRKKYIPKLI